MDLAVAATRSDAPDTLVLAKFLPAVHLALPAATRSGLLGILEAAKQLAVAHLEQLGVPDTLVEAAR